MSVHLAEIVTRIRPGVAFALEGGTLAGLRWLREVPTEVTETEVDQARLLIESEQAAVLYRTQRVVEYPAIGDQLDDLYRQGVFSVEMASQLAAVKAKYPKPA